MNNRYIITAESPLLQPGLTITTEVSEKYVIAATRTLLTKVRGLNEERETATSEAKKILHEMAAKKKEPSGPTLAETLRPKPKPTTVRIQPKENPCKETDPYMPMTERYKRAVDRRIRSRSRFGNEHLRR